MPLALSQIREGVRRGTVGSPLYIGKDDFVLGFAKLFSHKNTQDHKYLISYQI